MADVANKHQTTALFLSTTVTRTRRHITDEKTDKPDGKTVLFQRTFSSGFRADFYAVKLHSFKLECMENLRCLEVSATLFGSQTLPSFGVRPRSIPIPHQNLKKSATLNKIRRL